MQSRHSRSWCWAEELVALEWLDFWGAALVASPLLRAVELGEVRQEIFGYAATATHLRLDGLAFGFAASFIASAWPNTLSAVVKSTHFNRVMIFLLATLIVSEGAGGSIHYIVGPSVLAALFCMVLLLGLYSAPATVGGLWFDGRVVYYVALCSYSMYLMHPLAIHAAKMITTHVHFPNSHMYWPIALVFILLSSVGFYVAVERMSIRVRDYLVPRRSATVQELAVAK